MPSGPAVEYASSSSIASSISFSSISISFKSPSSSYSNGLFTLSLVWLNCEWNSFKSFSQISFPSLINFPSSLKGPTSFFLFFCLFTIAYNILGFFFIQFIALLSLSNFIFLFVLINSCSVLYISFSMILFFSTLVAFCLFLFNIFILLSSFLISFGIPLFLPLFFFFGIFSWLSVLNVVKSSSTISNVSLSLHNSSHLTFKMPSFIFSQSICFALKFRDLRSFVLLLVLYLF